MFQLPSDLPLAQVYLKDLGSIDLFQNFPKLLQKQQKILAEEKKRIELEMEKEQSLREILEKQMASRTEEEKVRLLIENTVERMKKKLRGKRIAVKDMLRQLKQTSPYRKSERCQISEECESQAGVEMESVSSESRGRQLRRSDRGLGNKQSRNANRSKSNTSSRSRSRGTGNGSRPSPIKKSVSPTSSEKIETAVQLLSQETDPNENSLVLGLLSQFLSTVRSSPTSSYSPPMYFPLFAVLLSITSPVSSESLAFVIRNKLPSTLFQMLLTRYSPYSPFYQDNETGATLYHLIAQSDSEKIIELLYQFYCSSDSSTEMVHLLKDSSLRSPLHVACSAGASRSLPLLHQISGGNIEVLLEKDKNGNTPLLFCTQHDRSRKCLEYILNFMDLHPSSIQSHLDCVSSGLHNSISNGAVGVGKLLLQSFLSSNQLGEPQAAKRTGWLEGSHLESWCGDLSLGNERYRVILDTRDIEVCREVYLRTQPSIQQKDAGKKRVDSIPPPALVPPPAIAEITVPEEKLKVKGRNHKVVSNQTEQQLTSPPRRSSRASIPVFASYTKSVQRNSSQKSIQPNEAIASKGVKRQVENSMPALVTSNLKKRKLGSALKSESGQEPVEEETRKIHRYSDRVGALSSGEAKPLLIEDPNWSLTEHMSNVSSTSGSLPILPYFIYSTEPYWGSITTCIPSLNGDQGSDDTNGSETDQNGTVSADCESYLSLHHEVHSPLPLIDLTLLRNGQRSPYSKDGLFDFSKGKIYECGPECSCQKNTCSLRLTQHGVSLPLVVCRVGSKGYGVMSTKLLLKGAFVCAYVGERVSEEDLQLQEENKLAALQSCSVTSAPSSSSTPPSGSKNSPLDVMTGYVTYAFQIHDGIDVVNIDSEYDAPPPLWFVVTPSTSFFLRYIGNVARFFNHSCNPNLRPVKVMCYREGKSYLTMAFFTMRRIEPGEELTWKYVSGVTRRSGQKCYCGSSNCAGFI